MHRTNPDQGVAIRVGQYHGTKVAARRGRQPPGCGPLPVRAKLVTGQYAFSE